MSRMGGDAGEDVGKPGLRIDAVHLARAVSHPPMSSLSITTRKAALPERYLKLGGNHIRLTIPERIVCAREPRKLPVVLSADEVVDEKVVRDDPPTASRSRWVSTLPRLANHPAFRRLVFRARKQPATYSLISL